MNKYKVVFHERVGSNDYIQRCEYVRAYSAISAESKVKYMFSCRTIKIIEVTKV
jgi:hypothetical protein